MLRPNETLEFICRDARVRVERTTTPFTSRCTEAQVLTIPVKHGEGNWYADESLYEELVELDQIVFRYDDGGNPNGSLHDVAGVCNREGNVVGLMPHPEHAVDPLLGPADGTFVLASLVDAARDRQLARV